MSMDAVLAISQRVDRIRSLVAAPAATRASAASSDAFAVALARADATGGAGPTTSAAAVLTAGGVPTDLAGYGNGRIPESALAPVPGSDERMWAPAAQALGRLRDAAAADGVTIGVTDGYRTYDEQADLVRRKGLYSQGGLAAAPGTSQHGWGLAADLGLDSAGLAWMRTNATRFGFAQTTPRESWHWEYTPSPSARLFVQGTGR